eukprot:2099474-Rhodomonas_salina.1
MRLYGAGWGARQRLGQKDYFCSRMPTWGCTSTGKHGSTTTSNVHPRAVRVHVHVSSLRLFSGPVSVMVWDVTVLGYGT